MDSKILLRVLCILMFLFALSGFVFGQTPTQGYQPTSLVLLDQALKCENAATNQYAQSQKQVADLTAQVTALTKERDELKAAKPAEK